jgi:hypothetical protein
MLMVIDHILFRYSFRIVLLFIIIIIFIFIFIFIIIIILFEFFPRSKAEAVLGSRAQLVAGCIDDICIASFIDPEPKTCPQIAAPASKER